MAEVDDWMTPTAWGATLGLSKQGAHKAVARCAIPRREDGKVSKAVADALYRARSRPRARATAPDESPQAAGAMSYQEARRREAVARATEAEADVAERLGQLVRVARLRDLMAARLGPAREVLRSAATRVGPLVAGLDAAQAAAVLGEEMRRVEAELRALAHDFEAFPTNPGANNDTRH